MKALHPILLLVALALTPAMLRAQDNAAPSFLPHPAGRFYLGGQINLIGQGDQSFPALYSGPNSFVNTPEGAMTRVLTLYTAAQLDSSTEAVFDLEETGGAGLSSVLGLAAFPNLDAVRNPQLSQKPYVARLFLHKVFGWGAASTPAGGPLTSFTELPAHRLELRVGKFSLADFFDVNSVGSDSHLQFMNWTIDNNGAWDYAADTRGYTVAAMVEYQTPDWGARYAEALMPKVANGIDYQWNLRRARAEDAEAELHLQHGYFKKHGAIARLLVFDNHANMGIYRVAIDNYLAGQTPKPEITAHPLQTTSKPGVGLNYEERIAGPVSAFARLGWADDRYESFAYTEVGESASFGATVTGQVWGRAHDKLGSALVVDGISGDHRRYLQLGGLGFLLGDGGLNYGHEKAEETFYTLAFGHGLSFAPDVQYIADPGYNRARGPVWVGALRLHADF